MKYTKEERLELGRKIYESGLSNLKAGKVFGISEETARRYRISYEESQGIEHNTRKSQKQVIHPDALITPGEAANDFDDYTSMTKEQLIEELMKARIRETRLKKGYMVKGVGAAKEYVPIGKESIK